MTWATVTDLLGKFNPPSFPRITELTGLAAGEPDLATCQIALDLAAAEMRSRLGTLTLPAADVLLHHIQLDLAYRNLFKDEIPTAVSEAATRHLATLKALASAEHSLGDPPQAIGGNEVLMTTLPAASGRGF